MKKPIRPTHGKDNNYERVLDRLHDILNGGIDHGGTPFANATFVSGISGNNGNVNSVHVNTMAPAVPNTEFTVTHNLNRIPVGYRVANRNNAGNVFSTATVWTTKQIFLKCDAGNTALTLEIY